MSFHDREERILEILQQRYSIRSSELAKLLYVSVSTLRRDLQKMEEKNIITKEHGMCKLNLHMKESRLDNSAWTKNGKEKAKIAKRASEQVKDGYNIMLDGSGSAYSMIPFLVESRDLLIITNSAKVSCALSETNIHNISTGGKLVNESASFVGQEAVKAIKNYNADIVFFSCRGLSEDGYLTDTNKEQNDVRAEMMKYADKKVALIDSSKIGKKYLHNLCHVSEVDEIICDEELPEYLLKMMKKTY